MVMVMITEGRREMLLKRFWEIRISLRRRMKGMYMWMSMEGGLGMGFMMLRKGWL